MHGIHFDFIFLSKIHKNIIINSKESHIQFFDTIIYFECMSYFLHHCFAVVTFFRRLI